MLTASVSQMTISSATKLCWAPVFFLPDFLFLLPVPDLDAILFPPYCCFFSVNSAAGRPPVAGPPQKKPGRAFRRPTI